MQYIRIHFYELLLAVSMPFLAAGQRSQVNVFLGSSGDHGQLSPAAGGPFGMMSILPQTEPHGHTGYEHYAKKVYGFTHTRFEGVGCMGSGGNILIRPFLGSDPGPQPLYKKAESGRPGAYAIQFTNGLSVQMLANDKYGLETYRFPQAANGFVIDLAHTLANAFRAETHEISPGQISGEISSGTTCNNGTYILYYAIGFNQPVEISTYKEHQVLVRSQARTIQIRIAFSAQSVAKAVEALQGGLPERLAPQGGRDWDRLLYGLNANGDTDERALLYSLLYRVLQSPFLITEASSVPRYSGWTIWDNYKTQLPLLSLLYPSQYQHIIHSLVDLYKRGKKNWATDNEPSNTVRTEHAAVVLLDAYRKGYQVDFAAIKEPLLREARGLAFEKPDQALESCYDSWAIANIFEILGDSALARQYYQQAAGWRRYWDKDFKDLSRKDVDRLGARGMYQGTIWQYRWLVPYDLKGLMEACGGVEDYISQLRNFFDDNYYNATNETDIQAPYMFSGSPEPWHSQEIIHRYAHDSVAQLYFNDNSRGIDAVFGRVYQNQPRAYPRTMDDDGGAMSAWYVWAATGLSPACVGQPVYYLHVPLFRELEWQTGDKPFRIEVRHFGEGRPYIGSATLNGQPLRRNWLTHQEIQQGGQLIIEAAASPNREFGRQQPWISSLPANMP
ncbi:glycoside hydrolase family 92 protein [Niabella terrae]